MTVNLHHHLPSIPQSQLEELFREVQASMPNEVFPSLTEIYFNSPNGSGSLENGTGAFVEVDGVQLLLSNAHVINKGGLHHSFYGADRFFGAAKQRYILDKDINTGKPIDIGASKVNKDNWALYGNQAKAIQFNRFANKHQTVEHEIIWMAGYPGQRVRNLGQLQLAVCEATATQEYLFHDGVQPHLEFDPALHFAVYYSPENAMAVPGSGLIGSPHRSSPPGLSGSLIWNTRRIECFQQGRPWSPDLAVVTGIVWGWPNENYLIATKVEYFGEHVREVAGLPDSPDQQD